MGTSFFVFFTSNLLSYKILLSINIFIKLLNQTKHARSLIGVAKCVHDSRKRTELLGDVKRVQTHLVLDIWIRAMFQQQLHDLHVASSRGVV